MKKLSIVFLCLLISGCSGLMTEESSPDLSPSSWQDYQAQLQQIHDWQLNGKIGIRSGQEHNSASLEWAQQKYDYMIHLRGPLGQGGASIMGSADGVEVNIAGEGRYIGHSPEALLYEHLGWQVPISDIYWWVRGLPSPNGNPDITLKNNRLSQLQQKGWLIQYSTYHAKPPHLPRKIKLSRDQLKLTLIVHNWHLE